MRSHNGHKIRVRGRIAVHARRAAAVAAIVCALLSAAEAQTNTGEILGVVRDAQGGLLPGATIVAEHLETRTRSEQRTDDRGRYHLPALRVGTYAIAVELMGFQRVVRQGVVVQLGQTLTLDFTLPLAGLTEEIRVIADTPLLQRANAEISDVIENREVVQLPLNGRNFLASSCRRAEPGAMRCSRPAPCRMSAASAPGTTSTCSTASR